MEASTRSEIAQGVRDSWTVLLGFIPIGLALGVLVVQMGFSWWWTPIFSTVIYAGSMEFLALGLVTGGTSWFAAALTGLAVNFRHIFYGITYPLHRISHPVARAYAVYALIDEVYALTGKFGANGVQAGRPVSGARLVTISAVCQLGWVGSGVVGALGGSALDISVKGMEFALTALFTVLAVEAFRESRDTSLAVTAVVCGLVAAVLLPGQMLLVALTLYVATLVARFASPELDARMTWKAGA
ncbi:AzlC family ABC transporter permease [Corynebacterium tapiri]|uniref:AzlC family ABC transporter permease n=1 Tax=Corynebacterium tapiri TaxID=1448266 RepID=A0A5C4U2P9_9CORY|nr:AzlC family ABC transporter permease [Corynebacterium tapiri]TNL96871.1 AzlC family ABC transporter permease [Corynebacterium tapiri]